jgi:Zn finger protein HypA/HybF involved in hydrogenase expression
MPEAYCVKCKAKKEMLNPQEVEMKGKGEQKRYAMKGTCPDCGTSMFRIMGKKA